MLLLKRQILDLLRPDINCKVTQKHAEQKKAHDEHSREQALFIRQRVMARNYRAGPVWIPGTTVE